MRKISFKKGDRLRIRQWDDMAEEFGINKYGNISCSLCFTEDMRSLCGATFIAEDIKNGGYIFPISNESNEELSAWNISTDMVELVIDEIHISNESGFEMLLS